MQSHIKKLKKSDIGNISGCSVLPANYPLWSWDCNDYDNQEIALIIIQRGCIFWPGLVFNLNSSKIGSALFYTWAEGSCQFSCFNLELSITNSWNWLSLTRVSDRPATVLTNSTHKMFNGIMIATYISWLKVEMTMMMTKSEDIGVTLWDEKFNLAA